MQDAGTRERLIFGVEVTVVQCGFFLPAQHGLRFNDVANVLAVVTHIRQRPVVSGMERVRELLPISGGARTHRPQLPLFAALAYARLQLSFLRPPLS